MASQEDSRENDSSFQIPRLVREAIHFQAARLGSVVLGISDNKRHTAVVQLDHTMPGVLGGTWLFQTLPSVAYRAKP